MPARSFPPLLCPQSRTDCDRPLSQCSRPNLSATNARRNGNHLSTLPPIVVRIHEGAARHIDIYDYFWSYVVMKQVRIAELKSKLSEFLRAVQRGESICVLDRNTAIAQIVPIRDRSGLRVRKPASSAPAPNKVPLPKPAKLKIDVVDLLLEERQSNR